MSKSIIAFAIFCFSLVNTFSQPRNIEQTYGPFRFSVPENWSTNANSPVTHSRLYENPAGDCFFGIITLQDTTRLFEKLSSEIPGMTGATGLLEESEEAASINQYTLLTYNSASKKMIVQLYQINKMTYCCFLSFTNTLSDRDLKIVKNIITTVSTAEGPAPVAVKQKTFFQKYWWLLLIILLVLRAA
ncbi:MAG: hypothetical protein WCM76_06775 [Bacteroidota bacterium]